MPVGLIIASPHSSGALGASKEGASEDEGAAFLPRPEAALQSFERRVVESHAVEVMNVAVFPVAIMKVVFGHGGLWTVEDGGFVHIIPDPGVRGGADELFEVEEGFPPGLGGRVETINPVRRTRPTPAFIDLIACLIHNTKTFVDQFVTDSIVFIVLDVRVDDCDKLLFISNHSYWIKNGMEVLFYPSLQAFSPCFQDP